MIPCCLSECGKENRTDAMRESGGENNQCAVKKIYFICFVVTKEGTDKERKKDKREKSCFV